MPPEQTEELEIRVLIRIRCERYQTNCSKMTSILRQSKTLHCARECHPRRVVGVELCGGNEGCSMMRVCGEELKGGREKIERGQDEKSEECD